MIHKVYLPSATVSSATLGEALRAVVSFDSDEDDHVLFTFSKDIEVSEANLQRMAIILEDGGYDALYSDYYFCDEGSQVRLLKLLDYTQGGRLREDFDFGKLLLVKKSSIVYNRHLEYAAFYYLRLGLNICHLKEPLYSAGEQNKTDMFAYQNPRSRDAQKEFEVVCKDYLWKIGALMTGAPKTIDYDHATGERGTFPVEASVIIPVYNRVRTIKDAVISALSQQTEFPFNVIVIDNHSTDGTTEAIDEIEDERLVHIIPEETTLKIGGCWNKGVCSPQCGRFAVQLDSDDVYSGPHTLAKIVDAFHREKAGMVIGSYQLTDFEGRPISDHLIDHSEWTEDNGRNNALRINGLGAPRAYYTPLVREYPFPDVSYGEDYAVVIRIARSHRVGRIYENLYNCRRWEGNSDSNLSFEKTTENNSYKDSLRTMELIARKKKNETAY